MHHIVSTVVGDVWAPVEQENVSIGFLVELVTDLGSVGAFVNPIIQEVTNVDTVLVLQYHVVKNTVRVHNVSNLRLAPVHNSGMDIDDNVGYPSLSLYCQRDMKDTSSHAKCTSSIHVMNPDNPN